MTCLLASSDPMSHVYQWIYLKQGEGAAGFTILSNHTIMQVIAALLLILLVPRFVKLRDTGDAVSDLTPRGLGHLVESICHYLREEVARPILGPYTDRFVPYVWSVFFYVLVVNLLGLLPLEPLTRSVTHRLFDAHHGIGGSATGNIWVTGTLAGTTFFMVVFNGLRLGRLHYIAHFCPGPLWLAPLLVPVELIGLVAKMFALCVRLFANMVAGHVLLAVLAGFIAAAYHAFGWIGGTGVGAVVVVVSIAFNLLELFVAFLQAFIFTFLTVLFIGQAIVFQHNGHEEGAH